MVKDEDINGENKLSQDGCITHKQFTKEEIRGLIQEKRNTGNTGKKGLESSGKRLTVGLSI